MLQKQTKQIISAILLTLVLTLGVGVVADTLGIDGVSQVYACSGGSSTGGGDC